MKSYNTTATEKEQNGICHPGVNLGMLTRPVEQKRLHLRSTGGGTWRVQRSEGDIAR